MIKNPPKQERWAQKERTTTTRSFFVDKLSQQTDVVFFLAFGAPTSFRSVKLADDPNFSLLVSPTHQVFLCFYRYFYLPECPYFSTFTLIMFHFAKLKLATMEDQVVRLVAQNNHDVSLIQNKIYNDVVEVLSHALAKISRYLREINNAEHDALQNPDMTTSGMRFADLSSFDCLDHDIDANDGATRFVARSPLCIDPETSLNPQTAEILSYTCLYNFALACHVRALSIRNDGPKRERFLDKALYLYGFAQSILFASHVHDVNLFSHMALVCNIGHVHYLLENSEQSEIYLQLLLESVMCAVERGENADILQGFISNVVPLILDDPKTAPGA
jgi:hypothetical protein